jgi:hypothetical protein
LLKSFESSISIGTGELELPLGCGVQKEACFDPPFPQTLSTRLSPGLYRHGRIGVTGAGGVQINNQKILENFTFLKLCVKLKTVREAFLNKYRIKIFILFNVVKNTTDNSQLCFTLSTEIIEL